MLVQALASYADTYLKSELEDLAFEVKPLHYWIELADGGRYLGISERSRQEERAKGKSTTQVTVFETFLVPKSPVNRNSGVHPLLGCDALHYVLGPEPGVWTQDKELPKQRGHHEGFVELIRSAALQTGDAGLQACAAFYDDPARVAAARKDLAAKKPRSGALAALCYRPEAQPGGDPGGPVCGRRQAKAFWSSYFEEKFRDRHKEGGEGLCLISGEVGPIAVTHEKVKRAGNLGGQAAGVLLMSFDKAAFCSYGWEQNSNSPISIERAAAYVLALNDLMRPGEHRPGQSRQTLLRTRRDYGDVAFLFWTRRPSDLDLFALVEDPDPEQVDRLLRTPVKGGSVPEMDPNDFYLLAVGATGARLVIRDWFWESLDRACAHLAGWVEDLRIADYWNQGRISSTPPLYKLLQAISPPREKPKPGEKLSKRNSTLAMRLIRRALHGQLLSRSILASALTRACRETGQRLDPARNGLIRLCVNDILKSRMEEDSLMNQELDPAQDHPAYICGRLMALYEGLQQEAHKGRVNVNVTDRYFSMASTFPQAAFKRLADLSLAHLRKLRRDNQRAAFAISRRIDELVDRLSQHGARFPTQFNLEEQGRFVIGYHHQRAEDARRISQAKAAKTGESPPQ